MNSVVSQISRGQGHEFLNKLEASGLDKDLAQRVIDSTKSNNLVTKVIRLIKNGGYESTTIQKIARTIMGTNFFGIEEAIRHFGVKPTKTQLKLLAEVPFTEGVLESCKRTHILVAVFPMSILDIWNVNNTLFYSSTGGWYQSEKFAKNRGTISWQLVCKTLIPGSMSKNWSEQQALLGKDDEILSSRLCVYTTIGHYKNTGERLFKNVCVRTSSVLSDGERALVGQFDSNTGFDVSVCWDDDYADDLGVSSVRKPT